MQPDENFLANVALVVSALVAADLACSPNGAPAIAVAHFGDLAADCEMLAVRFTGLQSVAFGTSAFTTAGGGFLTVCETSQMYANFEVVLWRACWPTLATTQPSVPIVEQEQASVRMMVDALIVTDSLRRLLADPDVEMAELEARGMRGLIGVAAPLGPEGGFAGVSLPFSVLVPPWLNPGCTAEIGAASVVVSPNAELPGRDVVAAPKGRHAPVAPAWR